jgi:hypothetical protein
MATNSNELEMVWKESKAGEAEPAPVSPKDLQAIIASRVKKEFKTVSEFVWAAVVYQIILYSFLTRTLVRHWGDTQSVLLCLAGAALYIPLTVALIRRVKKLFVRGSAVPDILHKVEGEYSRLRDFFQFKKRLDWIGVPVSCAIIVLVTFTLFVEGGVTRNPVTSVVFFAVWVGMSVVAIHAENKNRFILPLRRLEQVLGDLKHS